MRRLFISLFVIPIVACGGLNPTRPSTPVPMIVSSVESILPTPSVIPPTDTPVLPTSTPSNASTFPDPNSYTWQEVASGLERPVDIQPDGSGRLYIVEKFGRIRILQNGQLGETPFLDITDRVNHSGNEMGLLGLAFHPNFSQNGYFYVNYTGSGGNTFISRFQASGDFTDPNNEKVLLKVNQPFPNHNGGTLNFGPDGYLYAGLGDGGSGGDPFGNGQSLNVLLGKILRIDVDSAVPYGIPLNNPFGNEIWAYGLRNPWRISFDKATGDLYIGDVGQNTWEEIDYIPAGTPGGLNFGWNFREGMHDYSGTAPSGLTEPVAEYSHSEGGCSVTGGYVYRGSMLEWEGVYLFGDYCSGYVWGLIHSGNSWQKKVLFDTDFLITSFGQDKSGEIYLVSDGGGVYKLVRK